MTDTADRIRKIILTHPDLHGIPLAALRDETSFRDHLGADELVRIDLSLEIEDEFAILFNSGELDFGTIGELIAVVEQKLQDKLPRAAKVA